jgi:hypothetical protein
VAHTARLNGSIAEEEIVMELTYENMMDFLTSGKLTTRNWLQQHYLNKLLIPIFFLAGYLDKLIIRAHPSSLNHDNPAIKIQTNFGLFQFTDILAWIAKRLDH